jgi:hypothetical protein
VVPSEVLPTILSMTDVDERTRKLIGLEAELQARTSALLAELDAELEALRTRRDRLNHAISTLARKRHRYAAQLGDEGQSSLRVAGKLPKTDAADSVLREVAPRSMRLGQIYEELVRRGWCDDTSRDRHALEVAVRSLERAGRVVRPQRGWYRSSSTAIQEVAAA